VRAVPEVSRTFAADLRSVGEARRFLRDALTGWGTDGYDLGAPQVLTELATNAALHARSDYTVHVRLDVGSLLVEVSDSSPVRPHQPRYGDDATTGRGIAMVEALSRTWGVQAGPTGKTVWSMVVPDDQVLLGTDDGVVASPLRPAALPGRRATRRTGGAGRATVLAA